MSLLTIPTLVEDINSALRSLQNQHSESSRKTSFLQSVVSIFSRLIQCTRENTTCIAEWEAVISRMDEICVILRGFHDNLERIKQVQIPEPFSLILAGVIESVRDVAITLHKCQNARVSGRIYSVSSFQDRITRHVDELEDLLRNLKQHMEPKVIYDISLNELVYPTAPLDIDATATPCRYRLVECAPLTEHGILRIWEFIYFPSVPYSIISHVWKGNPGEDSSETRAEFSIRGAEDADPISTEVLHEACAASLTQELPYIWIDQLCVMQTNREDKNWQISRMYNMYRFCSVCIVIPGGLRRLVSLREETRWIHRGWTLQEALAPPAVQVLFSWTQGKTRARPAMGDESGFDVEIVEVSAGRSAMAPLWMILDGCIAGNIWLYEKYSTSFSQYRSEPVSIFGAAPRLDLSKNTFQSALPHVAALALAVSRSMQDEYDRKCYTIWKCSFMRTSSRPVDMVFSIMGLFDVSLDINKFDKNDRIGATIALTQEILRRGGRANWLGLSFHAPPSHHLSFFPNFPRTSVAGKALVEVAGNRYIESSKLMDNEYPNSEVLGAMPQGSMDADGCLTFEAKSVQIFRIPSVIESSEVSLHAKMNSPNMASLNKPHLRFKATNGTEWEAYEGEVASQEQLSSSDWKGKAFAVLLGCFFGYTPTMTLGYDCNNVRGMIVEEHAPGKYRTTSYFMLSIKTIDWVVSWSQRSFCIGGQGGPAPDANSNEVVDEIDAIEKHVPPPDQTATFGSILSKHISMLAREARERELLERESKT